MREIIIALALALSFAIVTDLSITAREADLRHQVEVLKQEVVRRDCEMAALQEKVRRLQVSHSMEIMVNWDLSMRLGRMEAGQGPVWLGD